MKLSTFNAVVNSLSFNISRKPDIKQISLKEITKFSRRPKRSWCHQSLLPTGPCFVLLCILHQLLQPWFYVTCFMVFLVHNIKYIVSSTRQHKQWRTWYRELMVCLHCQYRNDPCIAETVPRPVSMQQPSTLLLLAGMHFKYRKSYLLPSRYRQSFCHWSQLVSPITIPRSKLVSSWRSVWKWPLPCRHNCITVLWPRRLAVVEVRQSWLVHILGGMLWRNDHCKYWRQLYRIIY